MSLRDPGPYVHTYSKRKFFLDPHSYHLNDVTLSDIVYPLAHLARFNGHTHQVMSVGQHCCNVCDYVSEPNKGWGLLHDVTEAIIGDIPKPVKELFPAIELYESNLMQFFRDSLSLPGDMPEEVKQVDSYMAVVEARCLWGDSIPEYFESSLASLPIELDNIREIEVWHPERTIREFINRYNKWVKPYEQKDYKAPESVLNRLEEQRRKAEREKDFNSSGGTSNPSLRIT